MQQPYQISEMEKLPISYDGPEEKSFSSTVAVPAPVPVPAVTEIEEEKEDDDNSLFEIITAPRRKEDEEMSSVFSIDHDHDHVLATSKSDSEDSVYVAVGKSESSMDALCWTLAHLVNNNTIIYLIHIFPQIRYIPSPLGMLPKSQVNPTQLERYMSQERGKRAQLLQKFLDICTASKVNVDTMLIESDTVAKAILDLIPILNITKLVVGTNSPIIPSSRRKVMNKSSRGVGIADQLIQNAPFTCEVKVVCQGKEVTIIDHDQMTRSPSLRANVQHNFNALQEQQPTDYSFSSSYSCMCFRY